MQPQPLLRAQAERLTAVGTSLAGALDRLNGGIEGLQETGSILLAEGTATTSDFAGLAKLGHEIAGGEHVADAVFGEGLAIRRKGARAVLDAACGKRRAGD